HFSDGIFPFYSGLTKTSTALPRLSSKRTIL
ncbi:apbE family protein, partial [Neisseria meningitidis]